MKRITELELEDFVYENPDCVGVKTWIGRQIITDYGIIDLLGIGEYDELLLIELKAVPYNPKHIVQLVRYETALTTIAVLSGYNVPMIYKVLVTKQCLIMRNQAMGIFAANVQLITYGFSDPDTIFFRKLPYYKAFENDNRKPKRQSLAIRNYLNYLRESERERSV